jgi:hypothetical protein
MNQGIKESRNPMNSMKEGSSEFDSDEQEEKPSDTE